MAVPSSGPLELRGDINLEINGNVTDTNVALHQLSLDAGFSAPDAMSDFYGYSSVVPPSVSTSPVTSVSAGAQTLNGNVSNTGGENVSRGFYHGTSGTRTSNTKYTLGGTQGTGNFSCGRTGLSQGTTYYNWAFACNSAGESVGNRCAANTGYPPFTPNACCCEVSYGRHCKSWISTQGMSGGGIDDVAICQGYINPYNGGSVVTASCNLVCSYSGRFQNGYGMARPATDGLNYNCLRNFFTSRQKDCAQYYGWQSSEPYASLYAPLNISRMYHYGGIASNFSYSCSKSFQGGGYQQASNYHLPYNNEVKFCPQFSMNYLPGDGDGTLCVNVYDRIDFDKDQYSDIRLKTSINYL